MSYFVVIVNRSSPTSFAERGRNRSRSHNFWNLDTVIFNVWQLRFDGLFGRILYGYYTIQNRQSTVIWRSVLSVRVPGCQKLSKIANNDL